MAGKNKELFEAFQGLPSYAKAIVIIVGAGVVIGVPYAIYKMVSNAAAQKKMAQSQTDAQQDVQKLTAGGMNPSYVGTQYQTWANEIKDAINNCSQDYDTMNGTVVAVFSNMQNLVDVLQLIQAFGIQSATPCWQDITYLLCNISMEMSSKSWTGDLPWWLGQLYNGHPDGLAAINTQLQQKGINYTFH